jgi:hypothetical protein
MISGILVFMAIILGVIIPLFQNANASSIFDFFKNKLFPHKHTYNIEPSVGKSNNNNNSNASLSTTTTTVVTPPSPSSSNQCDQSLWNHVYQSSRLQIVNRCITVSGVIESIRAEPDGDSHIRLKLDPQFTKLINLANIKDQFGDLVLEPICQHTVIQPNAFFACNNFHQNINIPLTGTHVKVTGSYVLDSWHGKWAEIHPVTSITTLP